MSLRTDLAQEAILIPGKATARGFTTSCLVNEQAGVKITRTHIHDPAAASAIGKLPGRYVTMQFSQTLDNYSDSFKLRSKLLAGELSRLFGKHRRTLVAGLGNVHITPDALGTLCAEKVFATRHIKRHAPRLYSQGLGEVTVIVPGVLGQTGIEACDLVKAVCRKVDADGVIAVDALACRDIQSLGSVIQLTDTGISPGSGVENARKELSPATLGIPCVALGVPTVTDCRREGSVLMISPRTIDKLVENAADYISMAINLALHPGLNFEEIRSLV